MTTSVILSLPIADRPTRQVEVKIPLNRNLVAAFPHTDGSQDSTSYPLDEFIACCERQAKAMTLLDEESSSVIDSHIGGLMAAVMAAISEQKGQLPLRQLEMHIDCFSYILQADGFTPTEIAAMRPDIARTIRELYPQVFN